MVDRIVSVLAQRLRIVAVYLFGSYARGEAREHSDIDVAVFAEGVEAMPWRERIDLEVDALMEVDPKVELHLFSARALGEARPTNFAGFIVSNGVRVQ